VVVVGCHGLAASRGLAGHGLVLVELTTAKLLRIFWTRCHGGMGQTTTASSRTAGMAGGCFRLSRAAVGHLGVMLIGVVAVLRCCTAKDVRRSRLASSATSGSEWQCFVQLWPPWGMRRVSKTFPKVKSIIDLGEEVR
jgi:hypothetical protein